MPKLDLGHIPLTVSTGYPEPYRAAVAGRARQRLGDAAGLADFGVNLTRLAPGTWSSQRHYHSLEDEFIMVVAGTVILIEDDGETVLHAGECAAFPKAQANGHHLVNRSDEEVVILEVGSRHEGDVTLYSDIDMRADDMGYTRRDGTPFETG